MLIRKVDRHDAFNCCCDHDDVCEREVTHYVRETEDSEKKWLCSHHVEIYRSPVLTASYAP